MKKTEYVSNMPIADQKVIRYKITVALLQLGYTGLELDETIENAMNSRLSDLEELISLKEI